MGNTSPIVHSFYSLPLAVSSNSSLWIPASLIEQCHILITHPPIASAFLQYLYARTWLPPYLRGDCLTKHTLRPAFPSPTTSSSPVSTANTQELDDFFGRLNVYQLPNGSSLHIEEKSSIKIIAMITEMFVSSTAVAHDSGSANATTAVNSSDDSAAIRPMGYKVSPMTSQGVRRSISLAFDTSSMTSGANGDSSFSTRSPMALRLIIVGVIPMYFHSEDYRELICRLHASAPLQYGVSAPMNKAEAQQRSELFKRVNGQTTQETRNGIGSSIKSFELPIEREESTERAVDLDIGAVEQYDMRRLRFDQHTLHALKQSSPQELSSFLFLRTDWLHGIASYIELLPIAVVMCDARRPGFPIVYCNTAFELLTLYSQSELLGKSCSILQCPQRTETQQILKLTEALRHQVAIKVAITNVRRNREAFVNLLSIRPVINANGECTRVIGIAYDALSRLDGNIVQDLLLIDDLLAILHNMLCLQSW